MRLVEVFYSSRPEVFIARHIIALRETGLDPIMVAINSGLGRSAEAKTVSEYDISLGTIHIPFPSDNLLFKFFSLRHLLRPHTVINDTISKKIFASYLESLKPDLIHFQMGTLAGYFYQIPYLLKIPYTISLRGSDVQVLPFESPEKYSALKKAIEKSAGVHTVSDALWKSAKQTFDLSPDKVYHQTIFTTVPSSRTERSLVKKKSRTFVTSGRLHWTKSIPSLLVAFKYLLDLDPNNELIIIGDGDSREGINYWIRYLEIIDKVKLIGRLSYPEIVNIINQADAYVQSSIAEGFSNSTAEAMALGCPVFATDVGGTREIIVDSKNGFLLNPIKPEDWAQKFILVQDEVYMKAISKEAQITAQQVFSSKQHAENFKAFFLQSRTHTKSSHGG